MALADGILDAAVPASANEHWRAAVIGAGRRTLAASRRQDVRRDGRLHRRPGGPYRTLPINTITHDHFEKTIAKIASSREGVAMTDVVCAKCAAVGTSSTFGRTGKSSRQTRASPASVPLMAPCRVDIIHKRRIIVGPSRPPMQTKS